MLDKPFYFEIHDLLTQFVAAMDDVVIGRYNKNREKKEQIKVRYIHAAKERVLFDIVNKAQNITLPVISVSIDSISRDENRVFNKIDGMYTSVNNQTYGKQSAFLPMPVPVNLSLSLNVLTNYQSDMDQILSNFVPYSNPYIIISWKIPKEFGIKSIQEIRSEVLWDGTISLEYPNDIDSATKTRFIASTTFTIKGWLFPQALNNPFENIYFVKSNFRTTSKIDLNYDDIPSLSAEGVQFDKLSHNLNETEVISISGSPYITNLFTNKQDNLKEIKDSHILIGGNNSFTIYGKNFDTTTNVLISSNDSTIYTNFTSFGYKYYPTVNGFILPKMNYNIVNKNTIVLNIPHLSKNAHINFVILNSIGWKDTNSLNIDLLYISNI